MYILIALAKGLSVLITGVLGGLAVVTDYRNKDTGELTAWGRKAIFGIAISTSVALGLSTLESLKGKADAREAQERAQQIISSLDGITQTAQTTAEQQGQNLDQLGKLSNKMDTSLASQNRVLIGTEAVQTGLKSSLLEQHAISKGVYESLFPLESLNVYFTVDFPDGEDALSTYLSYLKTELNRIDAERGRYRDEHTHMATGTPVIEGVTILDDRGHDRHARIDGSSPHLFNDPAWC